MDADAGNMELEAEIDQENAPSDDGEQEPVDEGAWETELASQRDVSSTMSLSTKGDYLYQYTCWTSTVVLLSYSIIMWVDTEPMYRIEATRSDEYIRSLNMEAHFGGSDKAAKLEIGIHKFTAWHPRLWASAPDSTVQY